MDVMMKIYNALMADDYIKKQAGGRIKFYEYPETATLSQPAIIIDSLGPPLDSDYGDNDPLAEEYLFQIDVWTKNRNQTKELARRVKEVMRSINFNYYAGGVDEYDKETKIYRDARRFRGKIYTEDVETLV
ncbi:hypothetical protein HU147_18510 [Planomicrobium chinense]|uniref:DUF3168 domain-containing protein n=1 Tax=Planococcus chinensis TaxID=272917 RepID=UPI001CC5D64A|nr:DUF3168 domain-containing protein [Planococcus chinensis]MBZ5203199.1 hypothetical protein [Planococcus chinensis]